RVRREAARWRAAGRTPRRGRTTRHHRPRRAVRRHRHARPEGGRLVMNLLVVGASHHTADLAVLERLAVAGSDLPDVLAHLVRRPNVAEAVVLSTCNRVEFYAGVTSFHGGLADVSGALAERAGMDSAALAPHLYVRWDADAVRHARRVAAGLDSMVVGETQVLGQLRAAYAAATEADTAGRLLHDL